MQTQTLKQKLGRSEAISLALANAVKEHMVNPKDILAVDVLEMQDSYKVRIYLKGNAVAVYASISKDNGEIYSEVVELIPNPTY